MTKPTHLFRLMAAGFLAATTLLAVPGISEAQQQRTRVYTSPPPDTRPHSGPLIGGYSMTLSDVWGPAKMPPAPKDFGPHFDFQPDNLNQGLSHSPYPD